MGMGINFEFLHDTVYRYAWSVIDSNVIGD